MSRALRPRATSALVVAPVAITDRTCAAITGLEPRDFRALVAKLCVRHVLNGRRLVVLVTDFVAAIEAVGIGATITTEAETDDGESGSVDQRTAEQLEHIRLLTV